MHAIVYHGPGDKRWEEVPDPKLIDDTDAIVRVDTATICGTDLHILKGDVPAVTPGASSVTRPSARSWRPAPASAPSAKATGSCCPASPRAGTAASAAWASTASASAVAAGSSAT